MIALAVLLFIAAGLRFLVIPGKFLLIGRPVTQTAENAVVSGILGLGWIAVFIISGVLLIVNA